MQRRHVGIAEGRARHLSHTRHGFCLWRGTLRYVAGAARSRLADATRVVIAARRVSASVRAARRTLRVPRKARAKAADARSRAHRGAMPAAAPARRTLWPAAAHRLGPPRFPPPPPAPGPREGGSVTKHFEVDTLRHTRCPCTNTLWTMAVRHIADKPIDETLKNIFGQLKIHSLSTPPGAGSRAAALGGGCAAAALRRGRSARVPSQRAGGPPASGARRCPTIDRTIATSASARHAFPPPLPSVLRRAGPTRRHDVRPGVAGAGDRSGDPPLLRWGGVQFPLGAAARSAHPADSCNPKRGAGAAFACVLSSLRSPSGAAGERAAGARGGSARGFNPNVAPTAPARGSMRNDVYFEP